MSSVKKSNFIFISGVAIRFFCPIWTKIILSLGSNAPVVHESANQKWMPYSLYQMQPLPAQNFNTY